ncbi:MAG TPA: GNAT family N-acetyltransferase [Candidatus Saccharimonadia bacterium]|jgi:ribosomal protein S18 acetylase RimI-like enzyme
MGRLTITQASIFDLPVLRHVFVRAVEEHFSYFPADARVKVARDHSLLNLLQGYFNRRRVLLIAKQDGHLIGYAIGAAPVTGPAQLFWLYVDPDQRGRNTGLKLLSRMLKLLAERGADVVSLATHDHRRYYERQGFKFHHSTMQDGVSMDILTFKVKG